MSKTLLEANTSGWIAKHRELYLADGEAGHLWDSTAAGGPGPLPTLLLTTIGRKSGIERSMPLLYGKVENGYAIVASKGGAPEHPGWFHNLRAQESVKVQVKNAVFQATTTLAEGVERAEVWDQMVAMYPPYAKYKVKAGDRVIPLVILHPV